MANKGSNTSNEAQNSVFKNMWIKLTGPAAQSLGKAFLGQALLLLQENKGAKTGAEEEDGTIRVKPLGQDAKDEVLQVTGRGGTTARVKTVSPTRIVVAGTAQAEKSIKVLKAYRIILLGKTGAGKSSLANTIFGEDVFKSVNPPVCGTSECRAESKSVHGRRITLIDTPGFFDTDRPEEQLKPERVSCITECAPHALYIVLHLANSEQDRDVTKIIKYLPTEAFKYAVVVFTHGDQLPKGTKIEKFVSQNKKLSDLVKKCGGRCHVVDNVDWKNNQHDEFRSNKFQVAELLNTTNRIVMENKGSCYNNKMLQAVKREIKEGGNTTSVTSTASNELTISKNVWIKLTGPAAESLARAFCGPAAVALQETVGTTKEAAEGIGAEKSDKVAAEYKQVFEDEEPETEETKKEATNTEEAEKQPATEAEKGEDEGKEDVEQETITKREEVGGAATERKKVPEKDKEGERGAGGGAGAAGTTNMLRDFLQASSQNTGVILLVVVFYLLLLVSFCVQVPIVVTLFLLLLLVLLLLVL